MLGCESVITLQGVFPRRSLGRKVHLSNQCALP